MKKDEFIASIYCSENMEELIEFVCENLNKVISGHSTVWNIHTPAPIIREFVATPGFQERAQKELFLYQYGFSYTPGY